ncbi:MAG: hypothetical protein L0Z53_06510 [Acidobacteriales bacterium]|nr:hypothetical protein [Terriglobales bacterium]
MAEKALVSSIYAVDKQGSVYVITGTAAVTDGLGGHINFDWQAQAPSLNPLLPPWRTRVRDAIVDKAAIDHSLAVDEVLFPDFGVLGF